MKTLFFCLAIFAGTPLAMAQKSVDVKTSADKEKLVKGSLAYKSFYPGKVVFKDNAVTDAMLNYNRVTEEMLFINPTKHDTLALSEPETVAMIAIGNDVYRYNAPNGYVVKITNYPDVNLNGRIKYKKTNVTTTVADGYGGTSNTTASQAVGTYGEFKPNSAVDGSLHFNVNANETYTLTETYYLSNADNIVYADKKGFSKMFPKQDKELKAYVAANKVDFLKQEDIEKLLQYAQSLKEKATL